MKHDDKTFVHIRLFIEALSALSTASLFTTFNFNNTVFIDKAEMMECEVAILHTQCDRGT
jgi:hypothetical protein